MKILFDHPQPFLLTHGGFQVQIEQTKAGLEAVGVQVEFLRWWDDQQMGDVIHYFGRPLESYIEQAHAKGMKVVVGDLLSELGSRPRSLRLLQRAAMLGFETVIPKSFHMRLAWRSFRAADACVALTPWEGKLLTDMFGAPASRVHVVPNGVESEFFREQPAKRGSWLVCTATITQRKRVLELAQAAVQAGTPVWIIGKPYGDTDPYARAFLQFAKENPSTIRYEGPVKDRAELARIYRESRGFVLLSDKESLSISALEATACECPLLLSDLPWARYTFANAASYCALSRSIGAIAQSLKKFYDAAPQTKPPPRPKSWPEVAAILKRLYEQLLNTSS